MVSLITEKEQGEVRQQWISDNSNNESISKEIIAASGISVRLWRLYAYFWFVCLVFPIFSLIQTPPSEFTLFLTVSGIIIFVSTYFWVMWPHPVSDQARTRLKLPSALALVVVLTALVFFLSILNGSTFLWLFIGVSAIAGMILSFRNASIAVMSLTLLTVAANLGLDKSITSSNWLQIIPLALLVRGLGLDMIGFVRLSDALRELQKAREDLAHQAVTEERLRMARDLHDLLGHSLSLITLKSDLAGRLLEKDPRAATQQVHEVERVARQALREVREAVAGYRQRTLHGELDGARQILEAAGIECTIEYRPQSFPPEIDMVLAWIVREGVTNVIRHSRASHCLIRVLSNDASIRAEIRNDGFPHTESSMVDRGTGFSGLAERLAKVGGTIEAGTLQVSDGPGYLVKVEIPV
jgi:two-component system, NarL family, sensor histidine kinase DesK